MSIQLVLIEAVPSLNGVVRDGASYGSEAESEADEESGVVEREGKISINMGHIRSIDSACKVLYLDHLKSCSKLFRFLIF